MFVGLCWVETADVHMDTENDKQVGKKIFKRKSAVIFCYRLGQSIGQCSDAAVHIPFPEDCPTLACNMLTLYY